MRACFGILKGLMSATAALALAACGGGTGGTGAPAPGGPATAASFGVVTNVTPAPAAGAVTPAQITVNGVTFSASNTTTTVKIDDNPKGVEDLRPGMVVTVTGDISGSTGTALHIVVDDSIKGRIEQVIDANQIHVMGQVVRIDDRTLPVGLTLPLVTADAGKFVTVHGHSRDDGTVLASRIQHEIVAPSFSELKGIVVTHSVSSKTFTIGSVTVEYGGSSVIVDNSLPSGDWTGLMVEARGNCTGTAPVCGTLLASKVERSGVLGSGEDISSLGKVEVEGFVTKIDLATPLMPTIWIGDQSVQTSTSTIYSGGAVDDIVLGARIEAEGSMSGGLLTARKISFRDNIKLEGNILVVTGDSFTIDGLSGITVTTNSITGIDGGSVAAGSHVVVRGYATATGNTVVATELKLSVSSNSVVLQGPVAAISGTTDLTILGMLIPGAPTAIEGYFDIDGTALDSGSFFAKVVVGTLVKAKGQLNPPLQWKELELED